MGLLDNVNLLIRNSAGSGRQVVAQGRQNIGRTVGTIRDGEALIEPSVTGAHHGLGFSFAVAECIGQINAGSEVALIVNFVLCFPAQAIAEGEFAIDGKVILIEEGEIVGDGAGGVLIVVDDRDLVLLRGLEEIRVETGKRIGAVGTGVAVVGVAIGAQASAEVECVATFGSGEIILDFVVVLIVANRTGGAAAIGKCAGNGDAGDGVLRGLVVANAAIAEADVVDKILTHHDAVAGLQGVLFVMTVGSLLGKRQFADVSVGEGGVIVLIPQGQRVRLTELKVEARFGVETSAGIADGFVQVGPVGVGRGDAGRIDGVDDADTFILAVEKIGEVGRCFRHGAADVAIEEIGVVAGALSAGVRPGAGWNSELDSGR